MSLLRSLLQTQRRGEGPLNIITAPLRKSKYDANLWRDKASPKRGNNQYYKGSGTRNEGVISKRAQFRVIKNRLLCLNVPDLTGFEVLYDVSIIISLYLLYLYPYSSLCDISVAITEVSYPQLHMYLCY